MNPKQNVPAVAPIKSVIPPVWYHAFGVSLSRTHFVFLGFARQMQIKTPYCGEAGETKPTSIASRQKQAV